MSPNCAEKKDILVEIDENGLVSIIEKSKGRKVEIVDSEKFLAAFTSAILSHVEKILRSKIIERREENLEAFISEFSMKQPRTDKK